MASNSCRSAGGASPLLIAFADLSAFWKASCWAFHTAFLSALAWAFFASSADAFSCSLSLSALAPKTFRFLPALLLQILTWRSRRSTTKLRPQMSHGAVSLASPSS